MKIYSCQNKRKIIKSTTPLLIVSGYVLMLFIYLFIIYLSGYDFGNLKKIRIII